MNAEDLMDPGYAESSTPVVKKQRRQFITEQLFAVKKNMLNLLGYTSIHSNVSKA